MVGPVKSLFGVAGPNASLKDTGGGGVGVDKLGLTQCGAVGLMSHVYTGDTEGFHVSRDGYRWYRMFTNTGQVCQRLLSEPWNFNSAGAYVSYTFSGGSSIRGLAASNDGTKVFTCDSSSVPVVRRHSVPDPDDISFGTVSLDQSLDVTVLGIPDGYAYDIAFNALGDRLYLTHSNSSYRVCCIQLVAPFDLTGGASLLSTLSSTDASMNAFGISILDDERTFFLGTSNYIGEYKAVTPGDLSTVTLVEMDQVSLMKTRGGLDNSTSTSGAGEYISVHPEGNVILTPGNDLSRRGLQISLLGATVADQTLIIPRPWEI